MPCYSPLSALRRQDGGVSIVPRNYGTIGFTLACGRCIGCRLRYSQMWAIRCVHEASLWPQSCAVTLTYRDDSVPAFGNLVYRDFQLFLKRLRKKFAPLTVRFFCGGEYGEKNLRPHFHALLFNVDFADKIVYKSRDGRPVLWSSAFADSLWRHGRVVVGEASFDSAAYIARYMVKKVYGDLAESHYRRVDTESGEIVDLNPELAHMSLKPGIGLNWARLYWRDFVHDLKVVDRGNKVSIPRYYLKYVSRLEGVADLRDRMQRDFRKLWCDATPRRLKDKARVAAARLGLSRRVL